MKASPKIALSGGTGFLGSELLRRILTWDPSCRVALLLRARVGVSAEERAGSLLLELFPEADERARASERLEVYETDLAVPGLGLGEPERARLLDGLTVLYHLAADVRFDLSLEEARLANVESTRNLLKLAEEAHRSGAFRHFHHVSTFAAARRHGLERVTEDATPLGPEDAVRNTYERTKAEAESLVLGASARIPASIHRVSVVGGDSRSGWTGKFDTFYLAIRLFMEGRSGASGKAHRIPVPARGRIDLVTVDFAADALYVLGKRELASGGVFHITAGDHATPVAEALRDGARRFAAHLPRSGGEPALLPEFVPVVNLSQQNVTEALGGALEGAELELLSVLERALPYALDGAVYSNERLLKELEGTRVRLRPFHERLDEIIGYCVRSDWGKIPEPRPRLGSDPLLLREPIAIVGAGCVLPNASGVSEFWAALREARGGISLVPAERWDAGLFCGDELDASERPAGFHGGFVRELGFDPREFRVPPLAAQTMDRLQKMVLLAARQAIDGGAAMRDSARVGAVLGYGGAQLENDYRLGCRPAWSLLRGHLEAELRGEGFLPEETRAVCAEIGARVLGGAPAIDEDALAGSLANVALGRIMSHYDLKGPSFVVSAGDVSGLAAVDQAMDLLHAGECDAVVAGAAHALLDPATYIGRSREEALSPSGTVKPFSSEADGTVPAEGAVMFVLKRASDAARDGDRVLALIRGCGRAGAGRDVSVDEVAPAALVQAAREAGAAAGFEPGTLGYVETHGSGIAREDRAEAEAMRALFPGEGRPQWGALKARVGHLGGAGGAAGLLKAALVLFHGQAVPEAITEELGGTATRLVRAGVSSLGDWGQACHLILEKAGQPLQGEFLAAAHPEPVAVVGMGAVLPAGIGVENAWRALLSGEHSIRPLPAQQWEGHPEAFYDPDPEARDKTYGKLGALAQEPPLDAFALGIPPAVLAQLDRSQRHFLGAAGEALGGLEAGARATLIVGESKSGMQAAWRMVKRAAFIQFRRALLDSAALRDSGWAPERIVALAKRLESHPAVAGEPMSEDSRSGAIFASALARFAKSRDARGGHLAIDAACASSLAAFAAAVRELRLGKRDLVVSGGVGVSVNPVYNISFARCRALSATGSRPFDESADGIVLGEGSVVLVLKRLSDAQRDGDRIEGIIRGIGASSDGRGHSMMAPDCGGQRLALERGLRDAGCEASDVQAVECHATGTRIGDESELKAVSQVYAPEARAAPLWIGSIKAQVGHTVGAAGAAGALKMLLGFRHGLMPPTPLVTRAHPDYRLRERGLEIPQRPVPWPSGLEGHPRRAAVSAFGFGGTNWHLVLEEAPAGQQARARKPRARREAARDKTVVLFPGHGAPYPDMARELVARSSVFRSTLAEADQVLRPLLDVRLEDLVFVKDAAHPEAVEQALLRTDWVQPVIVAFDVAFYRALRDLGLRVDAVLGHSVGQLAAAVAAGMISFEAGLRAAHDRGRIFRKYQEQGEDTGAMSAVFASAPEVRAAIEGFGLGAVWVANANCPSQTVISGSTADVAVAEKLLADRKVEARRLRVSVAWHSPLASRVGAAEAAEVFGRLAVSAPRFPVLCNVDSQYYEPGEAAPTQRFVQNLEAQLGTPMDFPKLIRKLHADGFRVFVEAGPRSTLTGFVSEILGSLPHTAVFSNHPKASAFAQLRAATESARRGRALSHE